MSDQGALVLRDVADGVAVLTWNRPEHNNTWTIPMEEEYFAAIEDAAVDPEVRAIVVTGAGRTFCPGMAAADLGGIATGAVATNPELRRPQTLPLSIPKPIIAAINGACAGIGLIQALVCDVRFASREAKFSTAFSRRGIMAEHGIAWLLPRIVGTSKALDLLLSARVVQGQEALDLGLVDRLTDREDVLSQAIGYARDLAVNCSPLAMGTIKRQVHAAFDSTLEEARRTAIAFWTQLLKGHPDFKEGVQSYVERRPPEFAAWDPATPVAPPF